MLLPTYKIRLVLLLQLLLLVGTATTGFALNFNAYWLYRQVGSESADTRREFQQRYSLGVGPTLTYQPTRAISASGTVSYSRTERGRNGELVAVDQLTPAGQIRLVNDIFLAQLSGSNTRRYSDVGEGRSATSWDATLGSTWQIPFFPSVGFNYGERTDDVNTSLKTTFKSASVNWDLLLAKLSYSYQESQDEDKVNQNLSRTRSHFARIESSGRFWNQRIGFNFAQQFLTSNSNSSRLLGQALSLVADPPADPSQEDVALDSNTQLVDGNREAAAVEVPAFQRVHLGLTFGFNQQVGILYIYLDPLTAADPGLQWDVYARDLADTVWERQASGITAVYNASEHRLELTLSPPLFQKKIMVAADNNGGTPVTITEIEAGTALQENIHTSNTDYLTNVGLNAKITRTVDATANLSLERLNTESDQTSIAYDHRTLSSRLRWAPVPYLIPSIGYSETEDQQTEGDEQLTRSYSLIVTTIPLPTMTVTLGGTRTERYVNQVKTETTDQYSLYTKARIYPDLTANLSLSQRYQAALDADGQTRDTTSFSARLNLNARLTQAVIADLTTEYAQQRHVDGTSQNASAKLQLLYRPSDLLAFHGSYDKDLLRSETPATLLLGMNLTLLRTDKARLNLVTNYRHAESSSNNLVLTGSWDINRNWALQSKANYTLAEQYHYDFFVSMSLRL